MSLSVEGHDDIFEVSPRVVTRRGKFVISVTNNKKLDYEKVKAFKFKVGRFIMIMFFFRETMNNFLDLFLIMSESFLFIFNQFPLA